MLTEFFFAIKSYKTAFRYMMKRSLWKWQIIPGTISLILGALILGMAYRLGNNLGAYIMYFYPFEFGTEVLTTLFNFFGKIMLFVTGLFMYRWVLLILIGPFLSVISEQVEKIYLGTQGAEFSLSRMFRDIKRGIRMTFKLIRKELKYTFLNFFLGLVPIIGIISYPLSFLIQGYFAGFGNMDFTMERHFTVKEREQFVKKHKGLAIGNGLVFILILSIPIIGLILAPTLAVIASTLNVLDFKEKDVRLDEMGNPNSAH